MSNFITQLELIKNSHWAQRCAWLFLYFLRFVVIVWEICFAVSCTDPDELGVAPRPEACYAVTADELYLIGQPCDFRNSVARSATGACALGAFECIRGNLVCRGAASPEIRDWCVGQDTDCDGDIQPQAPTLQDLCYSGDVTTLLYPDVAPCRPGVRVCGLQGLTCAGEVLPKTEILDNCIDDDCDGVVDTGPKPINVVIVLDTSRSMDAYYGAIRQGLRVLNANSRVSLWLIDVPVTTADFWYNVRCHPQASLLSGPLSTPIAPCDTSVFSTYMSEITTYGGGREPVYDALQYVAFAGRADMALRDGTDQVIVFADESPTEPENLLSPVTTGRLQSAFRAAGWLVRVYAPWPLWEHYSPFAEVYDLNMPPSALAVHIPAFAERTCTP